MSAGLFRLLSTLKQPDIIEYLDGLSYDELIVFDPVHDSFKSLSHVTKKYSLPLKVGSFSNLLQHMKDVLVSPEDKERFAAFIAPETLSERLGASTVEGLICDEFQLRLVSGVWRWAELILLAVDDSYRLYFFDIQSRKSRELGISTEFLNGAENRNELTGLLKKSAFTRRAEILMSECQEQWCFISIDIENFKLFNEWYGHDRGNFLMAQIGAKLIAEREKNGGLAGYFGQDDFCLLMPYDQEKIRALYDDISAMIDESGNAADSGGFMPAFGISIDDGSTSVRNLMDRAFLATRFAKENYHTRIRLFEKSMYLKTDEEYRILTDFLHAMKNQEITFYLQPQCRSSSGKIVGAEALARWVKSDGTYISPGTFIPVLEKHGLITDLDTFIWESVCRWLRSCIDKGIEPLPISVNVSQLDIVSLDLAEHFAALVKKYDLPQKLIKIEITESAYISNAERVADTVQRLQDKGFLVMMDDFGSGFSSLNMLRSLNVDVIKLDAHFLSMNKSDELKGIHIIESIVNLTKTIGIPIIVEGVESEDQKEFLDDLGCRYIQGYYFFRPMDAESFERLTADPDHVDATGLHFKANQQFRLREMLDDNVYSDAMLNNILGPCAFYALRGDSVDIVRYNEQFYRAVGVPDFTDRLVAIEQYVPAQDRARFRALFSEADEDRLNGASGMVGFYRTDGSLSAFFLRIYYLHTDEDASGEVKMYYGVAQDVTKLTNLEIQMGLLRRYSPDTVVFLRLEPERSFEVLFHGLRNEMGGDAQQFERMLNNRGFYARLSPGEREEFRRSVEEHLDRRESFVSRVGFITDSGDELKLIVYCDYVRADSDRVDYIITIRSNDTAHSG